MNPVGGSEILSRDIFEAFGAKGHDCLMLTATSCPGKDKILNLLSINPFPHKSPEKYSFCDKAGWLLRSRKNYFATKRVIEHFAPDVVYLHNLELIMTSPLRAAIDSGRRVVVHAHNGQYSSAWHSFRDEKKENLISRIFKLRPNMNGVHIIAISKYIADSFLKEGFPTERMHLIYNGLPENMMAGNIDSPRERKSVFVGSISPHKGVHVAIEALGLLKKEGIILPLDIIGKPGRETYFNELRELASKLDMEKEIKFCGPMMREEILRKLRNVELLLFPSLCEEAFGLVAAEAMASGAIVIGSNRGAIPEVVGDAGFIVEPTGEKVAEAVKFVTTMDEKQKSSLRGKAADRVMKLFSLNRNMLAIEEILSRK